MELKDIKDLIAALPFLIIYIVPGYIYLWIKSFLLSQKDKQEGSFIIIKSVVISYIIIILETSILELFKYKQSLIFTTKGKLITICVSILASFIVHKFTMSDMCSNILKKLGINKTFRGDIWHDLADLEHGLPTMAYLGNERVIYYGELRRYEEKREKENYILVLSNYVLYDYDSNELVNYESDNTKYVVLNTKDISRIELFYNPDSKKITRNRDNDQVQQQEIIENATD